MPIADHPARRRAKFDVAMTWTDIEDICIALDEEHPDLDPLAVRFTELRELVEKLPEFDPEPGQSPNEQILEAIQAGWHEERRDARGGGGSMDDEDVDEDDEPRYRPNDPFR